MELVNYASLNQKDLEKEISKILTAMNTIDVTDLQAFEEYKNLFEIYTKLTELSQENRKIKNEKSKLPWRVAGVVVSAVVAEVVRKVFEDPFWKDVKHDADQFSRF